MLSNILIDYFKNLPYLAVKEVAKHLEDKDLVLLSMISPEWEKSISSRPLDAFIRYMMASKEKFEIKMSIRGVPPGLDPNEIRYHHYENTVMIVQFINSDTDKEVITEEIHEDTRFSTSYTRSIIVYRKNWEVDGSQRILEIARLLNQKFQLDLKHATIDNATWMTRNDLLSLSCKIGRIGDNQLTDKDFNAFLHSWMAGNHKDIRSYLFKVGDDVKIDQVIRGLITEKWNSEKRDRKFIPRTHDKVAQPPIDMADGLDITRPKTTSVEMLATVHITDNTLYFIVWNKYDTFEEQLEDVRWNLALSNRELLREPPGSWSWNYWADESRKCLESLRNITGDPEADVSENEFPYLYTDIDEE